jgi:hypothetical protein
MVNRFCEPGILLVRIATEGNVDDNMVALEGTKVEVEGGFEITAEQDKRF